MSLFNDQTRIQEQTKETMRRNREALRTWRNMGNSLPSEWETHLDAHSRSTSEGASGLGPTGTFTTQDEVYHSPMASSQDHWQWDRSMTSTNQTGSNSIYTSSDVHVNEINIASTVNEELVTTVHYTENHFQVIDCSGKTGNRLHVKVIPFNNQRTYVEINHIIVLDLAKLQRVTAVLPCFSQEKASVEVLLDEGPPVLLEGCTPSIFAEAMVQLDAHFAKQPAQARTEISSVLDCYAYATPGNSLDRSTEVAKIDEKVKKVRPLAAKSKPTFWRRLRH